MIRLFIGGLVGGLAQFVVSFIFWRTPLSSLAFTNVSDADSAALQSALGGVLTKTGAGSYVVPGAGTAQGTVLFGRGPVSLVHFNPAGFPGNSPTALVVGLLLSIATMLLVALAMQGLVRALPDFAARLRVIVLFGLAGVLYFTVADLAYGYWLPWGYFLFSAVAQLAGFVAGGFVLARWFMAADAPVTRPGA